MKTAETSALAMETTGIGSLPHHNIDAAIEYSFQHDLPFLPQIPIRNPWEFMIPQALEGLPGLQVDREGNSLLQLEHWRSRSPAFEKLLTAALDTVSRPSELLERFEPGPAASSCWQPFLWDLEERVLRRAKVQISGPLTALWSLKVSEPGTDIHPELAGQIQRLITLRAVAMVRRLRHMDIQPVIFLDEPGLYGLDPRNPRHLLGLQELRILVQTLKKEKALVGLHCCSNTAWEQVLKLPLDILSIDAGLSLENLLQRTDPAEIRNFLGQGGRVSLGIIPTGRSTVIQSLRPEEIFHDLLDAAARGLKRDADATGLSLRLLRTALLTPACGLALHKVPDAETILHLLLELKPYIHRMLQHTA